MIEPYKSPQSVMSRMSCCGAKKFEMAHDEEGHEAEGVPHVEVSMEDAFVRIASGMSGR